MKIIDLTHTFSSDVPIYPGDPKSSLEQIAFIEKDTFNDHKLLTAMHVGTHMDAPLHMIVGGKRIDAISPEKFFGKGVLLDVRGRESIDSSVLEDISITSGSIVLLYTGLSNHYSEESYFHNAPVITEDFARKMVESKVHLVGMDMASPDADAPWLVHKILLTHEICIVENLTNLHQLLSVKEFEVIALPAKLESDAAPVRVIAVSR